MDKCDVVIAWYRGLDYWPNTALGLAANTDNIDRVILVNDEPWKGGELVKLLNIAAGRFQMVLMDHPHDGVGAHKCIREGIEQARGDYVVYMDGDIMLAPRAIEQLLRDCDDTTMLFGQAHDTPRPFPLERYPLDVPILRHDFRLSQRYPNEERWRMCRDSLVCVNVATYWGLGGHTLELDGYGCHDWHLGIRWMMRYGLDSVEMGVAQCYHMGGMVPGHAASPHNINKFSEKVEEYLEWLSKGARPSTLTASVR